uniref:NADH:flavin oxidoreductase/NADH oxidase N-terminal domain-containing protein n=1 Tax=Psilocybe cubensis TaxID=181762 RepID=A0A8H8CE90_PSICU
MSNSKLFQPITVGNAKLEHRVVLAPLSRFRWTQREHLPVFPIVNTYYEQRSRRPGTLLITEATPVARHAGGYYNVPGIWNQDQINGWKSTHIWAHGRAADPKVLAEDGFDFVAPSPIPITGRATPRELTIQEIEKYPGLFAKAAKNAVEAGFDGVEIHNANGYLLDQFVQDVSNHRTDKYGGNIENRNRLSLMVVDAVVDAIGPEKVGIRISPWMVYQNMHMIDPVPQFTHLVESIVNKHPDMAYLHVVEPDKGAPETESNDFLRDIWAPRPFISCGDYTRETAIKRADETGNLIAFGRYFISNPDLPTRIEHNIPFNEYDRKTFYGPKGHLLGAEAGYIDYPFADEKHEKKRGNNTGEDWDVIYRA